MKKYYVRLQGETYEEAIQNTSDGDGFDSKKAALEYGKCMGESFEILRAEFEVIYEFFDSEKDLTDIYREPRKI